MKICAAQARPVKGDIQSNIANHKKLIDLAIADGADTIIFPELSLTGYEPGLAKELATDLNDNRFDDFQKISDTNNITIGAGMPTKADNGVLISMLIFQAFQPRQIYSKQHLHSDEFPFFINGQKQVHLVQEKKISLAICYEISVPEHAEKIYKERGEIYVASVAKSVLGVEKAIGTLSDIAKRYSMITLMSNCIGFCDDFECGGKTSVWDNKGLLLGQLDQTHEGVLIIDTVTLEVIKKKI